MQEEVENRTVNLAISTTKLTGRTIIAGIRKYLQHREKVKMKKARDPAVHGKQSVKQLLGQNQGATNVEIDKESIRDFEKLAKKYGVDFAVRKDKSVDCRFLCITQDRIALGFGNRAVIHGHIWNVLRLLYHVPGRYSGSVGDFFYCGR